MVDLNPVQFGQANLASIPDFTEDKRPGSIRTQDVGFKHHDWKSPAGLKYDDTASSKPKSKIQQEIPLHNLHTIQPTVGRKVVESYLGGSDRTPKVSKVGKQLWIDDGHHMLAAAKLAGKKTHLAEVAEY